MIKQPNRQTEITKLRYLYHYFEIYIAPGADISAKNEDEQTPLLVSAIHGRNR